jgi:hypothetical protein
MATHNAQATTTRPPLRLGASLALQRCAAAVERAAAQTLRRGR